MKCEVLDEFFELILFFITVPFIIVLSPVLLIIYGLDLGYDKIRDSKFKDEDDIENE